MSRHGEYKVPGGKLVVADFDVVDGRLADVRITGDFFLYPDEALAAINAALTGAPESSSAEELAGRVRAALGPEVEMLGFSPDDIATVLLRGLAA